MSAVRPQKAPRLRDRTVVFAQMNPSLELGGELDIVIDDERRPGSPHQRCDAPELDVPWRRDRAPCCALHQHRAGGERRAQRREEGAVVRLVSDQENSSTQRRTSGENAFALDHGIMDHRRHGLPAKNGDPDVNTGTQTTHPGGRRQQHHPPQRGDLPRPGRLRSHAGRRWVFRARQSRRVRASITLIFIDVMMPRLDGYQTCAPSSKIPNSATSR